VQQQHLPGGERRAHGLCLAGVFWMALNLFRVTLADQMLPKTVDDKQSN
jgi:hypothetical protein